MSYRQRRTRNFRSRFLSPKEKAIFAAGARKGERKAGYRRRW